MLKYLESLNPEHCYGCLSCINVCHSNALRKKEDAEGFVYPELNQNLCTNCGLCLTVCPIDQEPELQNQLYEAECYGGQTRDSEVLKKSSSGGIFSELANYIFEQGGSVYGATIDEENIVKHIRITTSDKLDSLRGSKYVQSDISHVFNQIKKDLKDDKKVLFTGTPCQVAAIRLAFKRQSSLLFTADIICHGVPSPLIWKKYIEHIHKGKISDVSFRDCENWGVQLAYRRHNGQRIKKNFETSSFLYAFYQSLLQRPVCYNCAFAKQKRVADITMGDFWGFKRFYSDVDFRHGVSFFMINTPQGCEVFNSIKTKMHSFPASIEAASAENKNLIMSTCKPQKRDFIYKDLVQKSYAFVEKTYFRPKNYLLRKLKYELKEWLKSFLKRYNLRG